MGLRLEQAFRAFSLSAGESEMRNHPHIWVNFHTNVDYVLHKLLPHAVYLTETT